MVRTLVLFDAPQANTRLRIDSVLRGHGYVWLFSNARWSSSPDADRTRTIRALRARLRGRTYRLAFVDIGGRPAARVTWLTASAEEKRA